MADFSIPQPSLDGGASSPSSIYTYIIFREWCAWSDRVSGAQDDASIDRATAVLISICPQEKKREDLWSRYTEEKKEKGDTLTAATITAGGLMSYLSEILEFTSTAYGGF